MIEIEQKILIITKALRGIQMVTALLLICLGLSIKGLTQQQLEYKENIEKYSSLAPKYILFQFPYFQISDNQEKVLQTQLIAKKRLHDLEKVPFSCLLRNQFPFPVEKITHWEDLVNKSLLDTSIINIFDNNQSYQIKVLNHYLPWEIYATVMNGVEINEYSEAISNISYNETQRFIQYLSQICEKSNKWRLPSEQEWQQINALNPTIIQSEEWIQSNTEYAMICGWNRKDSRKCESMNPNFKSQFIHFRLVTTL